MRKIIFTQLLLICLGSFVLSCSNKENGLAPYLTIKQKTVNFSEKAAMQEVAIETNAASWSATVEGDANSWMVARREGSKLSIIVTANTEKESRKGQIKIVAGELSETIVVEQLGTEPSILVANDTYTLSENGGNVTLQVTSNIDYDILVPTDASWIEPNLKAQTRSMDMVTKEYYYLVAWNSKETERKAEITIRQKNGTIEKKVLITQKGQSGYSGNSQGDIKDDVKVPVSSAKASSFQSGEGIEKSFDGNYTTIYHSSWDNSASNYFPITLEYFFENQESIDYLVYYPRQEGSNGYFKVVEIWVSTKEKPTYEKVMDYDFKGSSSATKVLFNKPLVNPTSVKFVVKSGYGNGQGFASCAEMEFYRINPDNFDPLTLFTDITCSELKPSITEQDIEKISNNLYRNIAFYLHKGTYPREFRIQNYRAWPHPDNWARVNKTNTLSLLDNPTGISVAQGDELIVFVGKTQGNTLSLKVQDLNKPGGDGYNNASYYPLSEGVNKLKMRSKGLVYLYYHTPNYATAPSVKIHFATGKVNGYFDSRKHQASDWNRLLNAAVDEYFDVLGEHAHLTFPTAQFKTYAANNGKQLIDAYDDLVRLEKEFMGLTKYNRPTVNRAYFHAMYQSHMYSTAYRTAYNVSGTDVQKVVLDVNEFRKSSWGIAHEQGHSFQTRPGFKWHGMTEVTNNVHSLYVQTQWGNASRLETEGMGRYNNRYEKAYHSSFVNNTPHPGEEDVFCKLVSLWQLQLYFSNAQGKTDTYKDLYEKVRVSPDKPNAGEQQLEFVKMMCDITRTDLTDFFHKWGYLSPFNKVINDYGDAQILITQSQIDRTIADIKAKNYPLLTDKMEYICDTNWEIFKNKASVQQGSASKSGTRITMTGWKNVVAYEVYEDSKLVFVSNRSSFTLDNSVTANTKVFAVAYNGNKTEVNF